MKAGARRASYNKNNNKVFVKYFAAMYPNSYCHACNKIADPAETDDEGEDDNTLPKTLKIIESTIHLLTCPHRHTRNIAAAKLWDEEIIPAIEAAQLKNPKQNLVKDARMLVPFALRTAELLTNVVPLPPLVGAGRNPLDQHCNLRCVQNFHNEPAALGLIPKALQGALIELGVTPMDASSVADQVSAMAQTAIVKEYRERCKVIADERGQKNLFRQHVLGIAPVVPPPNP
jgi:hypothetical protein